MGVTNHVMEMLNEINKLFPGDPPIADDSKKYPTSRPCSLEATTFGPLERWFKAPDLYGFWSPLELGPRVPPRRGGQTTCTYSQKKHTWGEKPTTNSPCREPREIVGHRKGDRHGFLPSKVPPSYRIDRTTSSLPQPRHPYTTYHASKGLQELEVRTQPQNSRNSSSKKYKDYRQHAEICSSPGKPPDEVLLEAQPSNQLCIKDTKDGIGQDLPENHASVLGRSSEIGLLPMVVAPGEVCYLSQLENTAPGSSPGLGLSPTKTKSEEMSSYLCEQGTPESLSEFTLSSTETTLVVAYLSEKGDNTPGSSLELELSTVETDFEGMNHSSQGEERTDVSVSPTEAGSAEYESETSSDDAGQGMLYTVCQMVLDQMLSEDPKNIDLSASPYIKEVPGGTGGSGSRGAQKGSSRISSTSVLGSTSVPKRVTKRGKGDKEHGGGGKRPGGQGKKPLSPHKMARPCPYYLADPDNEIYKAGGINEGCRGHFSRLGQHINRTHLKPHQCTTCGYRSDQGQVGEHIKLDNCTEPEDDIEKVDQDTLKKYKLLRDTRNPSFLNLFHILFPDLATPPKVRKYDDLEKAYPMLSEALTNYMEPLLPGIISDFCKSAEFKNFHENNPSVDQELVCFYSETSDFAALEVGRNMTTMLSIPSVISQNLPASQDPGVDLVALPNIPDLHPPTPKTLPGLRSSDQTPELYQQFPQSGSHVTSVYSVEIKRNNNTSSPSQLELPSSPGPSFWTLQDTSFPRSGCPIDYELLNDLCASQEAVLDPKVGCQATPTSSYGVSHQYSSSCINDPSWSALQQHDANKAPNFVTVDQIMAQLLSGQDFIAPGAQGLGFRESYDSNIRKPEGFGLMDHYHNVTQAGPTTPLLEVLSTNNNQPQSPLQSYNQPSTLFNDVPTYLLPSPPGSFLLLDSTEKSSWGLGDIRPVQDDSIANELVKTLLSTQEEAGSVFGSQSMGLSWGGLPHFDQMEET